MTTNNDDDDALLRSVALQNARSILAARQREEQDLLAAQEAHREAHQRVTDILESITDGFATLDHEWRITYLNPKAEEVLVPLHKTRDDVLNHCLWDVFPDLLETPLEQHYRCAMSEHVTVKFEFFYPPLGRWFSIRVYPAKIGLSIYFLDITQRVIAETDLRQHREWFRITLASIGDAVITTDTQGRVTYLSAVAESMTGWSTAEASGLPLETIFRIVNEMTREIAPNPIARVRREEASVCLENHTVLICKDGRETAIEDRATPIWNAEGKLVGAVMVFHDVTARRKAEDAVHDGEARLRAIFKQAAVGIAIAGLDGRFLELNRKFEDILGYTEAELQTLTFADITHPDDLANTYTPVQRSLAGEIVDYSLEKRYLRMGWLCGLEPYYGNAAQTGKWPSVVLHGYY